MNDFEALFGPKKNKTQRRLKGKNEKEKKLGRNSFSFSCLD